MTVYGRDGRVIEPFTAERAQEEAQGASAGWITGYTEIPDDSDEPQRRIVYLGGGPGYFDIKVEGARFSSEPDKRFRIRVTAEELPADSGPVPEPSPDYYKTTGKKCPDDGACGHWCPQGYCFRVACCSPLSDYGERWPADIEAKYGQRPLEVPADG